VKELTHEEQQMNTDIVPLESLFPLSEAAAKIPGRRPGKTISRSTLERWRTKGARGIVLRTARVGTTICTCDQWLKDFFEKLNAGQAPAHAVDVRTPTQRERAANQARKALEAAWGN
jgi:hypothetical protein